METKGITVATQPPVLVKCSHDRKQKLMTGANSTCKVITITSHDHISAGTRMRSSWQNFCVLLLPDPASILKAQFVSMSADQPRYLHPTCEMAQVKFQSLQAINYCTVTQQMDLFACDHHLCHIWPVLPPTNKAKRVSDMCRRTSKVKAESSGADVNCINCAMMSPRHCPKKQVHICDCCTKHFVLRSTWAIHVNYQGRSPCSETYK